MGNVHVKQLFKHKVSMKPKGQEQTTRVQRMKSKIKQMYLPFTYSFNGNYIILSGLSACHVPAITTSTIGDNTTEGIGFCFEVLEKKYK